FTCLLELAFSFGGIQPSGFACLLELVFGFVFFMFNLQTGFTCLLGIRLPVFAILAS
ncbi:8188_t:CDS:2, partial [Racocetra persica]